MGANGWATGGNGHHPGTKRGHPDPFRPLHSRWPDAQSHRLRRPRRAGHRAGHSGIVKDRRGHPSADRNPIVRKKGSILWPDGVVEGAGELCIVPPPFGRDPSKKYPLLLSRGRWFFFIIICGTVEWALPRPKASVTLTRGNKKKERRKKKKQRRRK